jgi:uncharacterized membrane protein
MKENSRIEAFSDGVFAIAITLLVLELKVPPVATVHSPLAILFRLYPEFWDIACVVGESPLPV